MDIAYTMPVPRPVSYETVSFRLPGECVVYERNPGGRRCAREALQLYKKYVARRTTRQIQCRGAVRVKYRAPREKQRRVVQHIEGINHISVATLV